MTFEEILPHLKNSGKIIREGWTGPELYVVCVGEGTYQGEKLNPYFLINVEGEGYSMFTPEVCDILAEDWKKVD